MKNQVLPVKMRFQSLLKRLFLLLLFILAGCDLVEFSPYDDQVDADFKNLNSINLAKIENHLSFAEKDSFDFAVISDTHIDYDDLHKAVKWVNGQPQIKLLVHLGDQTDAGLKYEFENSASELNKLIIPFVVVVGNHDYLSQGAGIYDKVYGPKNFVFYVGSNQFIAFDDVVWENNNSKPDFAWLKRGLNSWQGNQFLLMHIPETVDQMDPYREEYLSVISSRPDLVRLHGHTHNYVNEWPKLTVDNIRSGRIAVISVRGKLIAVRMEAFK